MITSAKWIAIGIFGFILVLGIIIDLFGKEKCLQILDNYWWQWGTVSSALSYAIVIGILMLLIASLL